MERVMSYALTVIGWSLLVYALVLAFHGSFMAYPIGLIGAAMGTIGTTEIGRRRT